MKSRFHLFILLILPFSGILNANTPGQLPFPPRVTALTRSPNFFGKLILALKPDYRIVYKETAQGPLLLEIFQTDSHSKKPQPCFVGIHGGGWIFGDPSDVYPYIDWATRHGMTGISIQYRLSDPKNNLSVFDCVKDVRSAVRYIRAHARELYIDPDKIILCGSSAGGHLALAAALFDKINDEQDMLSISSIPNAIILLSAVVDTSPDGFGSEKIGKCWQELSPLHNIRPGLPPTLILHGDADRTVPVQGVKALHELMRQNNNDSILHLEKHQGHVYMQKHEKFYLPTLSQMETFLQRRGFIFHAPSDS